MLEPVTGGDYFIWLLPGIACALAALVIIFMMQSIFTRVPYLSFMDWMYYERDWKAVPVYTAVVDGFVTWALAYFAVKRLILNPHPPDEERHIEKEAEEE